TVIAWYRTGLQAPIAEDQLNELWVTTMPEELTRSFHRKRGADQHQLFEAACKWATTAIISRDGFDVALVSVWADGYEANDYIVDHVLRQPDRPQIAPAIWTAALRAATRDNEAKTQQIWRLGIAAHDEQALAVAVSAMNLLADLDDARAAVNVGSLFSEMERP